MDATHYPRDLTLLEQIELNPDVNQATLAEQLGVAVGTANFLIKRLIKKGYVKVEQAQRKKLKYIITPEGIAHRAKLTVNYIDQSMRLYRRTRQRVIELCTQIKKDGYHQVRIAGQGDLADICRLTCIEQNVTVVHDSESVPVLAIEGWKVVLRKAEKA